MSKRLNSILLIDDNKATNFVHKKLIIKQDFIEHIYTCSSGEEALQLLTSQNEGGELDFRPPELMFLDINMPGMNGWEFLEEYDDLPNDQKDNTTIFMLTTSINPDDRFRANHIENISGFLNKPLSSKKLAEIREEYFEK